MSFVKITGSVGGRRDRRVSVAEYRARIARKQTAVRWPGVRVQP